MLGLPASQFLRNILEATCKLDGVGSQGSWKSAPAVISCPVTKGLAQGWEKVSRKKRLIGK